MSKNTQLSQLVNGLYVDSAFNVGIGTTVPNYKLTVNGEVKTSGNFFAVNNTPFSTNGTITYHDTVGLVLRGVAGFAYDFSIYNPAGNALIANPTGTNNITFPNGNVGIGTSSPSYKLHVTGTSGVGARTIQADGTGTAFNIVSVVNDGSQMFLATEGVTAGTIATGSLAYAGVVDMNTNTALQFATFATVRMTITNGGNVGIGTSSPNVLLHLSKSGSGNGSMIIQTVSGNDANLRLQDQSRQYYVGTSGGNFYIYDANAASNRFLISSVGSVRVGFVTYSDVLFRTLYVGARPYNYPSFPYSIINLNPATVDANYGFDIGVYDDNTSGNQHFFIGDNRNGERMRILADGTVAIGTSARANAWGLLTLRNTLNAAGSRWGIGPDTNNSLTVYNASNVGVYIADGATSWTANSDINLKDIQGYVENAIDSIMGLKAIKFNWKSDLSKNTNIGLIAQEVEKVYPELIDKNAEGYLGVRYTELIPILVKGIQELKQELDTLKNK